VVLSESEQEWDGDELADSPDEEKPVAKRQRLTKVGSSNGTIDSLARLPAVSTMSKDQRKSSVRVFTAMLLVFLLKACAIQNPGKTANALAKFGFAPTDKAASLERMTQAASSRVKRKSQRRAAKSEKNAKKSTPNGARRSGRSAVREREISYAEPLSDDLDSSGGSGSEDSNNSASGSASDSSSNESSDHRGERASSRGRRAAAGTTRRSSRARAEPDRLTPVAATGQSRRGRRSTSAGSSNGDASESSESSSSESASSDDEGAAAPSRRPAGKGGNGRAVKRGPKAANSSESEESSVGSGDNIKYRIQYILAHKKLTARDWRAVTESMNTHEITRGSAWVMDDEEYFSNSPKLIEKYLIKWQHASFLHVSWETEEDLVSIVGSSAKGHFTRYRQRLHSGEDLFEDVRSDEFFPPMFTLVDRILDVDCDQVVIQKVDWKNARLPPQESAPAAPAAAGGGAAGALEGDGVPAAGWLHGLENCFVTVKWLGLPYRACTFENISDLRARGIEYELAMRDFYRREQSEPLARPRGAPGSRTVLRSLDAALRTDAEKPPVCPGGGELRDYQWEGVRWMLFNWSQRRNSILADEMGLGASLRVALRLGVSSCDRSPLTASFLSAQERRFRRPCSSSC
jgi:hypothetical protein